ncbi:MAG: hypothetical protein U9N03_06300 [Candidatus Caldatribacteriota bacterium]|nr:hypothetical protein [Candidatus Caldatribacteriota bacterium]
MIILLKYEIYRRWKWLAIRYAALIVLGFIFFNRISSSPMQYGIIAESMGKFFLVSIVVFIIIIIEGINMLKEDLYEPCGYLTFTIPQKERVILASKLLLLFIQLGLWGMISIGFGSIFFSKLPYQEISRVTTQIDSSLYPTILFILTAFFNFVLMVHLSLTLTKTLLVNKKYSGLLSIGIFFLLAYLIEKFYYGPFLNQIRHAYIEFGTASNINVLSGGYTAVFLNIILTVVFFTATAYLLENKINI